MTNKILTPRNARYLIVFFVILGLTAVVYGTTHKDLFDRGKRAYKSKQYSEAFSMFNQAVAQKPDKAKYQYNLGLAARKLKRYGIAYDAFSKAKTLDPSIGFTKKNNEFFKKLAEAKSRSGGRKTPPPAPRYAGAETARSHSESYEKGKQSYKNKDYKDAYQNFNEAIRHQPGKAKYHYNLGLAAKKLKRYREALNAFLEAKRIDPGLGFTKKKQEFYNKLTELQERLKESGSGSSPVASTRTDTPARAAAGSGAGKENFERGKRAYKNKEYKTAAKEFEKAVSQNPNKAKYHYNLGLAHMKLKDYTDALASLRKADRIDPAHKFTKNPDIYFDKVQELLTLIKDKKDAKKEAWEKSRRAKAIKSGG
ncbi:MAG: tetratricopeptide repeat protein, partial [bacterium]|nr:tetratricopeptide repeat protein [bacterium]